MTPRLPLLTIGIAAALILLHPSGATAHHEAIFGQPSSLVVSADRFITTQVFSRRLGPDDGATTETTALVSAGVRVSKKLPLTFTAVLPYSWIAEPGGRRTSGFEDVVLGVRYRHDLEGLQDRWQREGNFVAGVASFELNNGSIDHGPWTGPTDGTGSLLASFERGKWSMLGYGVARISAQNGQGDQEGNSVYVGGGVAYTPNEDFDTGRLISYQAGVSFEYYGRDRVGHRVEMESGGRELLVHPTLAYSPGHDVLFFGMVSVPIWQDFRDRFAEDAYRVGAGLVYGW